MSEFSPFHRNRLSCRKIGRLIVCNQQTSLMILQAICGRQVQRYSLLTSEEELHCTVSDMWHCLHLAETLPGQSWSGRTGCQPAGRWFCR